MQDTLIKSQVPPPSTKNRITNDPGSRQAVKNTSYFSSLLAPKFVDTSYQAGLLAQVHPTIRPFPGYPSGFYGVRHQHSRGNCSGFAPLSLFKHLVLPGGI